MKDHMARLREEALRKENERKKDKDPGTTPLLPADNADMQVARFLGLSEEEVANCCGSICPHCDIFLDKAIALVEAGHPHHLFMNPTQEESFDEALKIFRKDREEYQTRRQELMERMRR